LQTYQYHTKPRHLSLGKPNTFSWPEIERIESPAIIDTDRFAFIGYKNGFANLFTYTISSQLLQQLTFDRYALKGLDYHPAYGKLVFSKERSHQLGQAVRLSVYNYDLFALDPKSGEVSQLTDTPEAELRPRFSPDGKSLIFISDADNVFN